MLLLLALACGPATADIPPAAAEPAAEAHTVTQAFPIPEGFERVVSDAFGDSLRELAIRGKDAPIRTHDGRVVHHNGRVIELPLVPGDLQQCADSAIRLRAEWQRSQGKEVMFHATSGDPMPFSRFSAGETPYAEGPGLKWRAGSTGEWEDYLRLVFTWAGTASLEERDTVSTDTPRAGDLLVKGGFPGHAVVLLDVATRGDETLLLIGEGYMPAQDFHVEIGPEQGWWSWTDSGLALPHWPMPKDSLRRFTD